ncbi:hypothetical protein Tco_0110575 [Tanacetum coccineum]
MFHTDCDHSSLSNIPSSLPTFHTRPSLNKEIWHYCWKQWLNYIAGIEADYFERVVRSGKFVTQIQEIKRHGNAQGSIGLTLWIASLKDLASDEELEELMKDQPLSADASPTALSPGYIADSNPEEDKEDPEEDPADHPADG